MTPVTYGNSRFPQPGPAQHEYECNHHASDCTTYDFLVFQGALQRYNMDPAAMRQAFQRLVCTAAAATVIIDKQEINSIEELHFLMDADVETLCRNIKQPGGVAAAPAAGAHLGHMISKWAQKNINLAAYWLRHYEQISRACQPGDITVINVHSIRALRVAEDNYKDATPPVIDDKDWPRMMDVLHEYFRNTYSITK